MNAYLISTRLKANALSLMKRFRQKAAAEAPAFKGKGANDRLVCPFGLQGGTDDEVGGKRSYFSFCLKYTEDLMHFYKAKLIDITVLNVLKTLF